MGYKKFIFGFLVLFIMLIIPRVSFALDITMGVSYDEKRIEYNLSLIPIEIKLNNRDNTDFDGLLRTTIYESNESAYVYNVNVHIEAKDLLKKEIEIPITNKANTILVELLNEREELVTSSREIIDTTFDSEFFILDFFVIKNLLNIIDKSKLPNIFVITVVLILYLLSTTIFAYTFLRNIGKKKYYVTAVFCIAIFFIVVMAYIGLTTMRKNTFLNFMSIVDIRDNNTKEKAFLNFRTSESGSYSFSTGSENGISPLLEPNNEPIISVNFMDEVNTKYTSFTNVGKRKYVTVENAKDFDSNIFIYEDRHTSNDVYNIDVTAKRYDNEVSGRITNNMDVKIYDASIFMYGKVIKIGDIDGKMSVTLSRGKKINAPIGNNLMLSQMLTDSDNYSLIKYYLDENINGYFDGGYLFGFINENGTIDISSDDVGDVFGRTLLVKRIPQKNDDIYNDVNILNTQIHNVSGYYDEITNTTNGETEIINEYTFSAAKRIHKIYLEYTELYDRGNIGFTVPFYGRVSFFNNKTKVFDDINKSEFDESELKDYLDYNNKLIIRYLPIGRDPLYRAEALPNIRALQVK